MIVTHNGGNEWCKRDLNLIHTHSYKETFKLYMLFIHHLCLCLLPSRWVHLDTLNLPWQEFFSNLIQKLGSATSFILIFFLLQKPCGGPFWTYKRIGPGGPIGPTRGLSKAWAGLNTVPPLLARAHLTMYSYELIFELSNKPLGSIR